MPLFTRSSLRVPALVGGVALALAGCTPAAPIDEVVSTRGAVVSQQALASDAGAAILAKGGNAVDAAVATAFALAVTHPSAGNIGGGGFMVIRLADGTATTIDYRETARAASTETMYLDKDGEIDRAATASGWRAPGVPGTVRGLAMAHRKYGTLPWSDLVRPAIDLAATGFPLSESLSGALNRMVKGTFARYPSSAATYGKPGGGEWVAGDTLRLPQLARALEAIATDGPDAFYTGWIADTIHAQMKANKGLITKADLAGYTAIERDPVRGTFNGHEIIGMGPPSSGGAIIIMALNMLEELGAKDMKRTSEEFVNLRIEVARHAFLERARWFGDPDFVEVPLERLLSKEYAKQLAANVDPTRATSSIALGKDIVTSEPVESNETTHFSVVDADGNAVSNTYTLEGGYGSGVVVAGFLLNNEMGDFNKKPGYTNTTGTIGTPANRIQPGKRMLSSMAPVIVTKGGALRLVTGSPGGRTIPNTVLDVVLGVTLFDLGARAAVDAPRVHHQWMPDSASFEPGVASEAVIASLRAKGQGIRERSVRGQGDAHTIVYDAATRTARAANDTRSRDSKASAPAAPQP